MHTHTALWSVLKKHSRGAQVFLGNTTHTPHVHTALTFTALIHQPLPTSYHTHTHTHTLLHTDALSKHPRELELITCSTNISRITVSRYCVYCTPSCCETSVCLRSGTFCLESSSGLMFLFTMHMYLYILCVCVCACVCVFRVRGREKECVLVLMEKLHVHNPNVRCLYMSDPSAH